MYNTVLFKYLNACTLLIFKHCNTVGTLHPPEGKESQDMAGINNLTV